MHPEDALLQRVRSLGLADAAALKEAEEAVARLPEGSRTSAPEWLASRGRLRRSTLDAIREELNHPAPWWGRLLREAAHGDRHTVDAPSPQEGATRVSGGGAADDLDAGPEPFARYPLPQWSRFEPVALLREGGMGKVFKAWDTTLRRMVALKFLHVGPRPGALEAVLEEARAQARLDHPNVVRLLEAGEVDGLAYLVLAHVDGVSLKELQAPLGLRDKASILEGAAEGVHAIHRLGLIHRDLKPANILVRRTEDGTFEGLVTDFGVARDVRREDEGRGLVGTPLYMSPEQARGARELDRRTDVYALGASLYHALLGRPPFPDAMGLDLLRRIERDVPARPRTLRPDLPQDLEAVILKCLEKDPERRYPSALALAADLGAFLEGREVAARPLGGLARLGRWARRNRALAATAATALALSLAFAGLALQSLLDRRRANALAADWALKVARLESGIRQLYLLPTRDQRPDMAGLRLQAAALDAEVTRAGRLAEGPGQAALGRAYLALRQWPEAREHLDRAWQAGLRNPELGLARGEAYAQLYRQGLEEGDRLPGAELRARRRQQLDRDLRQPALDLLRAIPGEHLGQAWLALLDGRYETAREIAEAVVRREPWRYEALMLQGECFLAEAQELRYQGRFPQAVALLQGADPQFQRAVAVGRSDPAAWLLLAARYLMEEHLGGYVGARSPDLRDKAREALARTWSLNPESREAAELEARLLRLEVAGRDGAGPAQETAALQAEARFRHLAGLAGDRPGVFTEWSYMLLNWGLERSRRLEDPSELYGRCAAAAEEAVKRVPLDPGALNLRGLARLYRARWDRLGGGAGTGPDLDRAERDFRAIADLDATLPFAQNNLGWVGVERAWLDLRAGRDPRPAFRAGETHLLQALQRQRTNAHSPQLRAEGMLAAARWELAHGSDPRPGLVQALAWVEGAVETNPEFTEARQTGVEVLLALAEAEVRPGGRPGPFLARAATWARLPGVQGGEAQRAWLGARVEAAQARLTGDGAARARALRSVERLGRQHPVPPVLRLREELRQSR